MNENKYYHYKTDQKTETGDEIQYLEILNIKEERCAYAELSPESELKEEGWNLEGIPHIKDAPIIDRLLYILRAKSNESKYWSTNLDNNVVKEILKICTVELLKKDTEIQRDIANHKFLAVIEIDEVIVNELRKKNEKRKNSK